MTSPVRPPRRPRPPTPPPPDVYDDYADFYEGHLRWCYQRAVGTQDAAWCPWWRRHTEAVERVTALHRAWEVANRDGGTAMAAWFANWADPIMRELLDPRGTFKGCSPRKGHCTPDEGAGNGPLPETMPPVTQS